MQLDFTKQGGLLPVIVQHASNGVVLMLGYMNQDAYEKTLLDKKVTFFSRSKNRLWTKGETSGNFLYVVDIFNDCDHDALLIKAIPEGHVCHTGQLSCFNQQPLQNRLDFIAYLEKIIANRRDNALDGSYVSSLFKKGLNKIIQKVGEEAVETIIEAKDSNDQKFLEESADLLFHFLVLLNAKGVLLNDVVQVLEKRHLSSK